MGITPRSHPSAVAGFGEVGRKVLALVGAAVVTGCGGPSDEEQVRQTVGRFFSALANGNGQVACNQLTAGAQRELVKTDPTTLREAGGCVRYVEWFGSESAQSENLRGLRNLAVHRVQIDGGAAIAFITDPEARPRLEKTKEGWKINRIGL